MARFVVSDHHSVQQEIGLTVLLRLDDPANETSLPKAAPSQVTGAIASAATATGVSSHVQPGASSDVQPKVRRRRLPL